MDELSLGLVTMALDAAQVPPVVSLAGELDISCVEGVRQALEERLLGTGPGTGIVFELSALRFMDSSGIALLLGIAQTVGDVTVRNPSPVVRRIIEATGLSGILRMDP